MKRLVSLLMVLCLLFGLVACAGTESAAESSPESAAEESVVAEAPTVEEPVEETPVEASVPEEASVVEPVVEEPQGPPELELPLANGDVDLSVWWAYPPWFTNHIDVADKPTFVELAARTGINLEVVGVSLIASNEQFSLMMASSDYTSIIADFGMKYTGTYDQAIEDEIIIDLTDIVNECCPNYWGLMNDDPEVKKSVITNGNNVPGFLTINDENAYIRGGHWINMDMLSQVGMDVPETYDQWHDTLVAFRDQLGADAPLWVDSTAQAGDLVAAFDVAPGFYQVDGQVKYGYLEDGMKDYISMISEWYADGLIYKDFYTQAEGADKPDTTDIVEQAECGIWRNASNSYDYFTVNAAAISAPVMEEGQQLHFSEITAKVQTGSDWVITTDCEEPEYAAMMIDYLYSEEGILLTNYGVEGVSYELVDGKPVFTELMTANPDGLSFNHALAIYCLFNTAGVYSDNSRMDSTYSEPQLQSREAWAAHNDNAYVYPSAAVMTIPESEEYNAIYANIETYVEETILSMIIGAIPVDEYESFTATLEEMGIQDCIDIQQAALDRYNAR